MRGFRRFRAIEIVFLALKDGLPFDFAQPLGVG
jgi:hypothetical protein